MHKIFDNKDYIYFDMGNTLLDFHQGLTDDGKDIIGLDNMSQYLNSIGLSIAPDTCKRKFLDVLYSKFHLRESQLIEVDVYKILRSFLTLNQDQEDQVLRHFYQAYRQDVVLHDGALDLLRQLKKQGKYIGIISNCFLPAFIYKEIFEISGLDDYIDDYTFSYTHKIRKPNPDLFRYAFKKPYDKCLMIGDGFKPDVLGSNQLSVDSIWYNHKMRRPESAEHLKLTIQSLSELF